MIYSVGSILQCTEDGRWLVKVVSENPCRGLIIKTPTKILEGVVINLNPHYLWKLAGPKLSLEDCL